MERERERKRERTSVAQGFSVAFFPVERIFREKSDLETIAQVSVEFSAFLNMSTLRTCTNNLDLIRPSCFKCNIQFACYEAIGNSIKDVIIAGINIKD